MSHLTEPTPSLSSVPERTPADERQVGGAHYKVGGEEHWARVHRLGLDYFQAQITKYVERCWHKGGVQDLEKARHFLDKYLELSRAAGRLGMAETAVRTVLMDSGEPQGRGYVDQDR